MGEALMPRRGGEGWTLIASIDDVYPYLQGVDSENNIEWYIEVPYANLFDENSGDILDGLYRVEYEQTVPYGSGNNHTTTGVFVFMSSNSTIFNFDGAYIFNNTFVKSNPATLIRAHYGNWMLCVKLQGGIDFPDHSEITGLPTMSRFNIWRSSAVEIGDSYFG